MLLFLGAALRASERRGREAVAVVEAGEGGEQGGEGTEAGAPARAHFPERGLLEKTRKQMPPWTGSIG